MATRGRGEAARYHNKSAYFQILSAAVLQTTVSHSTGTKLRLSPPYSIQLQQSRRLDTQLYRCYHGCCSLFLKNFPVRAAASGPAVLGGCSASHTGVSAPAAALCVPRQLLISVAQYLHTDKQVNKIVNRLPNGRPINLAGRWWEQRHPPTRSQPWDPMAYQISTPVCFITNLSKTWLASCLVLHGTEGCTVVSLT